MFCHCTCLIDREVEDFARRLNPDWPDRIQDILFLSQGKPLQLPNGNCSMRVFTSESSSLF